MFFLIEHTFVSKNKEETMALTGTYIIYTLFKKCRSFGLHSNYFRSKNYFDETVIFVYY